MHVNGKKGMESVENEIMFDSFMETFTEELQ